MGFTDWIGEHSSTILTVVGIGASVTAGVLFARAGAKTAREIDDAREDRIDDSEDITPKEKTKIFAKNFWFPCAMEGLSIFAILGSGHIQNVKIAAATTSANLAANALAEYRQEVNNQFGKTADRKVRDAVSQRKVEEDYAKNDGNMPQVMNVRQPNDVLCKDEISGRYFWSTAEKIHRAENMMVREINDDFSATLNDWYGHLGIEYVWEGVGDYLEWDTYDDFHVMISATKTPDEQPCLSLQYNYTAPHMKREC